MIEHGQAPRSGELLDVVDEHGEPTGQVLPKKTVHAQGIRHRDVHVWVTNGRDLLQQQRTWDKTIMPGDWDISVGGHVGAGQSYLEAGRRETSEELGLQLPPERFIRAGIVISQLVFPGWEHPHNIVGDNFVVVAHDLQIADLELEEEEVLGARWYPIDQLETDLQSPDTALLHAPQPMELWALGITAMRQAAA
jgi:isopentenyldiphosphate isomerase